jgi:hypothetical protein
LIFYVDKSGKHRIQTYKDLKNKKVDNTLTLEEANIMNANNAKIKNELFNKAQIVFVDFVIDNVSMPK